MRVSKDALLLELPPYRDEWVMRKKHQQVKDIIFWITDAYPRFTDDYDRIGLFFLGNTVEETCNNLYEFCKQNIQYVEEGVDWQSIERPAGILLRGYCDCKGYANFIGGCLGAINRLTDAGIDWNFCFASYKIDERVPYHVFVKAYDHRGEIWIDPTPGANDMEPKWEVNKKIKEQMPLMENVGSLMENIGRVNAAGELYYEQGGMGATAAPSGDAGTDALIKVGQAYQAQIVSLVNQSGLAGTVLGDWITAAKDGPIGTAQLIGKWISGYKYTSGDYALGEVLIDRVLGQATTSRWNTPDALVPVAWGFFTTLLGIPIAVNTDLDNLATNSSLQSYLNGRPEQAGFVTQEQVSRAAQLYQSIIGLPRIGGWSNPVLFTMLPYVAPIPDPRIPGALYNGKLPNGQVIANGVPVTAPTSGSPAVVPGAAAATTATSIFTGNKLLWTAAALLAVIWLIENE